MIAVRKEAERVPISIRSEVAARGWSLSGTTCVLDGIMFYGTSKGWLIGMCDGCFLTRKVVR